MRESTSPGAPCASAWRARPHGGRLECEPFRAHKPANPRQAGCVALPRRLVSLLQPPAPRDAAAPRRDPCSGCTAGRGRASDGGSGGEKSLSPVGRFGCRWATGPRPGPAEASDLRGRPGWLHRLGPCGCRPSQAPCAGRGGGGAAGTGRAALVLWTRRGDPKLGQEVAGRDAPLVRLGVHDLVGALVTEDPLPEVVEAREGAVDGAGDLAEPALELVEALVGACRRGPVHGCSRLD